LKEAARGRSFENLLCYTFPDVLKFERNWNQRPNLMQPAMADKWGDVAAGLAPLPSVQDRLRALQPSHELLAYYREKIAEFDREHGDMVKALDRYKVCSPQQHTTTTRTPRQ